MAVSLKTDGKLWQVREQIIEDGVTELSLQFEVSPDGLPILHIFGPFGRRDFFFTNHGDLHDTGSSLSHERPEWSTDVHNM